MFPGLSRNLFLQAGRLEGEQELLNVVFSQLVDAPSVDGSPQKLVHLVLGVHGLLNAAAEEIKSLQKPEQHISDIPTTQTNIFIEPQESYKKKY